MAVKRQGVVHTTEAVVAAVLLMFFVLFVGPRLAPDASTGGEITGIYTVLEGLDADGNLRQPVMEGNLSEVKDKVEGYAPGRSVEVAVTYMNRSSNRSTFDDNLTTDFRVDIGSSRGEFLEVWFDKAEAPNVSLNGEYIDRDTGTVSGHRSYDVEGLVVDGSNNLTVEVGGESTVGYIAGFYQERVTGTPPSDVDARSASYSLSGYNGTFHPAEVTLVSWR